MVFFGIACLIRTDRLLISEGPAATSAYRPIGANFGCPVFAIITFCTEAE